MRTVQNILGAIALLTNPFVHANDAGLEGEVGVLYERALAAQEELRTEDALALLLQVEKVAPDNAKVLQKIARQYSDSTIDTSDDARQNLLLERALDYSQKATEIDPTDPVNMLSLAVVKGKIATLLGNKAKVEAARIIKADARRAIELDPTYAWAHHVLGRWHREVDELGSIARFFTKILYGGLPEASIEEAVFHLGKATELEPENLNHFLELGFAYRAAGEEEKARTNFERGLRMPIKEKHDEAAKTRARRALQQLG
jgi:tetratricopeptide (TPR) repeat protein